MTTVLHYTLYSLNYKNIVIFSFTLYPTCSNVGKENWEPSVKTLRSHYDTFILHFRPNPRGIACWMERRDLPWRSQNINYLIHLNGNQIHNLSSLTGLDFLEVFIFIEYILSNYRCCFVLDSSHMHYILGTCMLIKMKIQTDICKHILYY